MNFLGFGLFSGAKWLFVRFKGREPATLQRLRSGSGRLAERPATPSVVAMPTCRAPKEKRVMEAWRKWWLDLSGPHVRYKWRLIFHDFCCTVELDEIQVSDVK